MNPTSLGPFEVGEAIGEGGMSRVFRGRHRATGDPVALKVTRFERSAEQIRRAFVAEIAAMARMYHPTIVRIYDWGSLPDGSGNWCAMEWAPQGALNPSSIRSWSDLEVVLTSILNALAHAHARQIIHRDLKPQNVLVFDDSTPFRLADFGLAHSRVMHGNDAKSGEISGTPAYMAPEQLHGLWREFGPWTDLYALGCMAFHLAAGHVPFDGDSPMAIAVAHISSERPPLTPRFPVPEGFEAWIHQLIDRDWTVRPRTAAEALHQLRGLGPAPSGAAAVDVVRLETVPTMEFNPTSLAMTLIDQGFTAPKPDEHAPARRALADVPIPSSWREATSDSRPFGDSGSRLMSMRETVLVGHENLRDELWAALRRTVVESRPHTMIIEGEPTGERDRVVQWFGQRVREVSALPVFELDAALERVGADPFVDVLRETFGTIELDGVRLDEQLGRMMHAFGLEDVVGLRKELAEICQDHDSGMARLRARAALWSFIDLLTQQTPVVLLAHDVARDPGVWLLLERLVLDGRPVITVVAPRAEAWEATPSEAWLRDHSSTTHLAPERLSAEQATYVLESYIRLAPTLRDHFAKIAADSVSLAFDMVRQGASLGAFIPTHEGYRLRSYLSPPHTLREATMMRFRVVRDEQPRAARALTVAATIGPFVSPENWARAMRELGAEFDSRDVEWLQRHEFLRPLRGGYAFRSDEEREFVFEQLNDDDASALLETGDATSPIWALMRSRLHLLLGNADEAAEVLAHVDLETLNTSGYIADRWIARARDVCARLTDPAASAAFEDWIAVVRISCFEIAHPVERAVFVRDFVEPRLARAAPPASWVMRAKLSFAYCFLGRVDEAEVMCRDLLEEPIPDWLRGEVLSTLGWTYTMRGREFEAVESLEPAIELLVGAGHMSAASIAAQTLAITDMAEHDDSLRQARFARAVELSRKAENPRHYPRALKERAITSVVRGLRNGFLDDAAEAYRLGPWASSWMRASFGATYAICLGHVGQVDRAHAILDETARRLRDDDKLGKDVVAATRALVAALAHNVDQWDDMLGRRIDAPLPPFFAALAARAWTAVGDTPRAEQARRHFSAQRSE